MYPYAIIRVMLIHDDMYQHARTCPPAWNLKLRNLGGGMVLVLLHREMRQVDHCVLRRPIDQGKARVPVALLKGAPYLQPTVDVRQFPES